MIFCNMLILTEIFSTVQCRGNHKACSILTTRAVKGSHLGSNPEHTAATADTDETESNNNPVINKDIDDIRLHGSQAY